MYHGIVRPCTPPFVFNYYGIVRPWPSPFVSFITCYGSVALPLRTQILLGFLFVISSLLQIKSASFFVFNKIRVQAPWPSPSVFIKLRVRAPWPSPFVYIKLRVQFTVE